MLTSAHLKEKKNKIDPIVNALSSIGLNVYGHGHNGLGFAITTSGNLKNTINRSLYHLPLNKLTKTYVLEYFLLTYVSPLKFHKDIKAALNMNLLLNFSTDSGVIVEEHPYFKIGRSIWIPVEDSDGIIMMYQLNPNLSKGIVQQSFELTLETVAEFVELLRYS